MSERYSDLKIAMIEAQALIKDVKSELLMLDDLSREAKNHIAINIDKIALKLYELDNICKKRGRY